MFNLLDVFSGSQKLRRSFESNNYNVVSIDNQKYRNTAQDTIIVDFEFWNYLKYNHDHFNTLFFGLPCQAFSKASGGFHFDNNYKPKTDFALKSERLLLKVIDTINYFNSATFYIENPAGGLVNHPFMKDFITRNKLHVYRINFGLYGFPTAKQTDIITNNKILHIDNRMYRENGRYSAKKFDNLSAIQRHTYPTDFCSMVVKWDLMNHNL